MKRKGFTLIELLAVIVILAILALIVAPLIGGVIKDSKVRAIYLSAEGVARSGEYYCGKYQMDLSHGGEIDNTLDVYNNIKFKGEIPDFGELYIDNTCDVAMRVVIEGYCFIKQFKDKIYYSESCDEFVGIDKIKPTVSLADVETNDNGWLNKNTYVRITVNDNESGGKGYKYCISKENDCDPRSSDLIENSSGSALITTETINRLCAVGYDNASNESEVVCKTYKLDKTKPEISGIEDITVNRYDTVDLISGVSVNDTLSEIDGTFTVNPSTVDTSVAGVKSVEYSVLDKAGNKKTVTRKIIVDANAPTISYAVVGNPINGNGWAKENFYVQPTITDNSGTGIKNAKWCINQTDTCTPTTVVDLSNFKPLISTESSNNRICVQATDNNNKTSAVMCSDAYKLDKTVPTFNGLNAITVWKNDTVNLISGVSVNDTLSGINGTFSINPSTVDTSVAGTQTVKYTVYDNANNMTSVNRSIKIDANKPLISYEVQNNPFNSYGWALNDFVVRGTGIDNSGLGIKGGIWCKTTDADCDPDTSFTGSYVDITINTSSQTNKICIIATDNNGKQSDKTCSDYYKLDKSTLTASVALRLKSTSSSLVYQSDTWTNESVYALLSTNNSSLLKNYEYSNNGSTWNKLDGSTQGFTTNGTTNVYYRAVSISGRVSSSTSRSIIKIDKEIPVTPSITLYKMVGTSNQSYTAGTWSAYNIMAIGNYNNSDISGIKRLEYSIDGGGTYKTLGVTNTINVTTVGTTYYKVRAVDNAGNIGSAASATIKIDNQWIYAPSVTLRKGSASGSSYSTGTWSNSGVYAVLSASTGPSGLDHFEYSTNLSSWTKITGFNVGFTAQGETTVYFRAVNKAGFEGARTNAISFKNDSVKPNAPTITFKKGSTTGTTVSAGSTVQGDSAFALMYYSGTDLSGFDHIEFTADGSVWGTAGACVNKNYCYTSFGWLSYVKEHTIQARVVDKAGNVSANSSIYRIKTGPK